PGGELAYRFADLVPDPNTLVVVNCAGRTRSILGAESLRRAGVPNRVVALRNGTMGWELAGLAVARGQTERYAPGVPESAGRARVWGAWRRRVGDREGWGVEGGLDGLVDPAPPIPLAPAVDETDSIPDGVLVIDLARSIEFRAGHIPGAAWAVRTRLDLLAER